MKTKIYSILLLVVTLVLILCTFFGCESKPSAIRENPRAVDAVVTQLTLKVTDDGTIGEPKKEFTVYFETTDGGTGIYDETEAVYRTMKIGDTIAIQR